MLTVIMCSSNVFLYIYFSNPAFIRTYSFLIPIIHVSVAAVA